MKTELTMFSKFLTGYFGPIIGIIVGLLAPIQFILLLVSMFIVIDTIFGVYTAKKLKREITSRKLAAFIHKMLIYNIVIITVYALDKLLLGEFLLQMVSIHLVATKVAAIALVVTEIFSIDEKLRMLNNNNGMWSYLKRLLSLAKLVRKETKNLQE